MLPVSKIVCLSSFCFCSSRFLLLAVVEECLEEQEVDLHFQLPPMLGVGNCVFILDAAEECTSVLELDHNHTGALMLRAQTLVTLKEYQSALFDVNRLIELNPSSDVYHNLQARLKTQLSLAPIPESEEEALEAELEEEALEAELEEEAIEAELEEEESVEVELEEETMEADDQQEKALGAAVISDQKAETRSNNSKLPVPQAQSLEHSDLHPKGWEAIPKPKGHSGLDYSRWDRVEDDSSEEEDEAEDVQPQYRLRVRTVGVRPVK
ncbi:uncharacterized protein LOC131236026 [Magnolia sinica]|uniref:uncharacterized protein LOC131236026 n=1 Tax=Magnolia sinica TaxID=86752 RepID=UPI00265A8225|nr:uncharacterized protein LOC131236026 [Magnolia sinica]